MRAARLKVSGFRINTSDVANFLMLQTAMSCISKDGQSLKCVDPHGGHSGSRWSLGFVVVIQVRLQVYSMFKYGRQHGNKGVMCPRGN